jgi:hypothetical protein
MLSCVVGLWMAAVVGQAPVEASWLKSVPADIPVVARVRALEDVSGDLQAMLKTMSPTAAGIVQNLLDPQLQAFEGTYGAAAGKNPFFVLLRLPDPAQPGFPAWGVIVKADDPAAVIKGLAQDGGEKPKALDGYESFAAKDGQTWYSTKGTGWVAFGPDEAMIKAIRKPGSSLAQALTPEVRARFLAGDVGLYLNIAELQKQYGDFIEQVKPGLMAQLEQAPNARGPRGVESTKQFVDAMIEALKAGESLALSLDFDAAGLALSGLATVKKDSTAAKGLAQAKTGSGRLLEKLPVDKMVYVYTAEGPGDPDSRPNPVGKAPTSPAVDKAVAARLQALEGRLVMGIGLMPMQYVGMADPGDPQAAVKASIEADKARQASGQPGTTEPDAVTHGGFRFARIKSQVDPAQIAKLANDANAQVHNGAEIMKKMFTSNDLISYVGTDGKLFLEVSATSDDRLKAQVDAIKDGSQSLGTLASWKALRARLPEQATVLMLVNAQEMVKMILTSVGAMQNQGELKPPADFPRATALMGIALVSSPKGYDFRLIIPGDVGPVFEKGLAPLTAGQ